MTLQDLQKTYQTYHGRQPTEADISALGGMSGAWTSMTPEDFASKTIFPSEEFKSRLSGLGQQPTQPSGLTSAVQQAQQAFQPLTEAQNKLTQQQFDTLKQNIAHQKEQAIQGVSSTLASRGLERSGELGSDIANIEQTAQQALSTADINQTIQQAQNSLANWQNITGAASAQQQTLFGQGVTEQQQQQAQQQQQFQNHLATNENQFSQWLQNQNLNIGLIKDYTSAYSTITSAFPNMSPQDFPEEMIKALYRLSQQGGTFNAQ